MENGSKKAKKKKWVVKTSPKNAVQIEVPFDTEAGPALRKQKSSIASYVELVEVAEQVRKISGERERVLSLSPKARTLSTENA